MRTAVDTSVLLDVFPAEPRHGERSRDWLRAAYDAGTIIVCDIDYAEPTPAFGVRVALDAALRQINTTTSPIDTAIAHEAGLRWMRYRKGGGPS